MIIDGKKVDRFLDQEIKRLVDKSGLSIQEVSQKTNIRVCDLLPMCLGRKLISSTDLSKIFAGLEVNEDDQRRIRAMVQQAGD